MTTQIKANVLKTFIDKATVNGLIEDCKLVFGPNGIDMLHKDLPGIILVDAHLDAEAFEQYENGFTIEVKNSLMLSKILKTFDAEIIQITKEGSQALFQTEKGGYQLTLAEDVICWKEQKPELDYENVSVIPASQLNKIVERNKIVNHDTVYTILQANKFHLKVGKENDEASVIIDTEAKGEYVTQFDSVYFEKITAVFNDVVKISLDNAKPSKFTESVDKMTVTVYLTKLADQQGSL